MEDKKENLGKKQGTQGEAQANPYLVSVLYGGIGGWSVKDQSYGPGDVVDLNLKDKKDLAVLIQVMKCINEPKTNKLPYEIKNPKDGEDRGYHIRYTLVEETKKNIPKELLSVKFNSSGKLTEEQTNAVLALVPNFFEKKKTR